MSYSRLRLLVGIFLMTSIFYVDLSAQSTLSMQFDRTSIDFDARQVCYQIVYRNTGTNDWSLAGQNYRLFYNTAKMRIILDSLNSTLSSAYTDLVVVQSLEEVDASAINGNLPYESNLGFANFFIDLSDIDAGGIVLEANGPEIPTVNICFNIIPADIDELCLEMNFAREQITSDYAPAYMSVSEWIDPSTQTSITNVSFTDLNSSVPIACLDFIENTIEICTDGIDNDGDGLIDCLDPSCNAIGIICEDVTSTCQDGIDNDGDGDIDCDDLDCARPSIDLVDVTSLSCPGPQLATIDIFSSATEVEYSIDGGINFQQTPLFSNLQPGNYEIVLRSTISSCELDYFDNPVMILSLDCPEQSLSQCQDGIDNDGDGDIDCDDMDCGRPSITEISVMDTSCPFLSDGQIVVSSLGDFIEYSIDNGLTFQSQNVFSNLLAGQYEIIIRNSATACITIYNSNPVEIFSEICSEESSLDCQDGIDNDGDGDIDCQDSDCISFCTDSAIYIPNAFSPSIEDGVNDVLVIGLSDVFINNSYEFSIYDRWGNLMIEQVGVVDNNELQLWNGKFKNQLLNPGVFALTLRITDQNETLFFDTRTIHLF